MPFGKTLFVILVLAIICFVRLVIAFFKWVIQKSRTVSCFADVVGVENTIENYKNKPGMTLRKYTVTVDYQGRQYKSFIEETTRPGGSSKITPGSQVKLLFDPATTECVLSSELISGILTHLITLILCAGLFCLFFYLSVKNS